jgi:hypothetical protein
MAEGQRKDPARYIASFGEISDERGDLSPLEAVCSEGSPALAADNHSK